MLKLSGKNTPFLQIYKPGVFLSSIPVFLLYKIITELSKHTNYQEGIKHNSDYLKGSDIL